jgi:hypothetical protein
LARNNLDGFHAIDRKLFLQPTHFRGQVLNRWAIFRLADHQCDFSFHRSPPFQFIADRIG